MKADISQPDHFHPYASAIVDKTKQIKFKSFFFKLSQYTLPVHVIKGTSQQVNNSVSMRVLYHNIILRN